MACGVRGEILVIVTNRAVMANEFAQGHVTRLHHVMAGKNVQVASVWIILMDAILIHAQVRFLLNCVMLVFVRSVPFRSLSFLHFF